MKNLFLFLVFLITLIGCGSHGQKERQQLRKLVQERNFVGALGVLNNSKFYKSEEAKILAHLERGMIQHYAGNYLQSSLELSAAKDLLGEQIQLRISGKISQMLLNDNFDQYLATPHELSSLHLIQTLNYFFMYQQGFYEAYREGDVEIPRKDLNDSERRGELFKARSELVAWNGLLENFKRDKEGEGIFKDDLMAKLLGAQIHEAIDSSSDRQIALQLYRDAKSILLTSYSAYESFNLNAKNFRDNYKKMTQNIGEKNSYEMFGKQFNGTALGNELKDYIDYKILVSTKQTRPSDWEKMVKLHNPTSEVIERAKNTKKLADNMVFVMASGLIPERVAQKHYYGLKAALESNNPDATNLVANLGVAFIVGFAADKLGILPPPRTYMETETGVKIAATVVSGVGIAFELPKIHNTQITENYEITIKNKKDESVHTEKLILINDMGAIAHEELASQKVSLYTRTGIRVALKHAAAIVAAIAIYKGTDKSEKDGSSAAAAFSYWLASKGIEESEKADTRHWTTLPRQFRMAQINLGAGDYGLSVSSHQGDGAMGIPLHSLDRDFWLSDKISKQVNMFYH